MKSTVFIVVLLVVSAAFAEKQPISRYQTIVDRQMFGPLPPGFDPTKSPNEVQKASGKEEKQLTQEQEKLQSSIRFSVINVTPEGATAVGFTDNSDPKAPVHYYLKVGEKRNGWEVKEADANNASMTIAKGDIEVSLSLGGNSAKDGGTSRAGGTAPAAPASGAARRPGLLGGGSLRARRLQRQQEEQAAAAKQREEQAAKDAERQAQAEQEKQQREAERAEQRQQLLAIQEELKRVREAKAAAETPKSESDANNEAE